MRDPVPPLAETVRAEFEPQVPDPAALAEAAAYDQQDIPSWTQPDPAASGREFIQKNPEAQIEIVFPTVYEEDRSAKLADLITIEGVGSISHQRMAQQVAQELGFNQYDYEQEQADIAREKKSRHALTPTPAEDAAVEGFHEDLARIDRQITRLTEVVRSMPAPVHVTVPDAPPPTVEVRIPPVPDPPRLVKTVERDARGLITRIIVGEP